MVKLKAYASNFDNGGKTVILRRKNNEKRTGKGGGNMPTYQEVNLKELRLKKNLSQQDVADVMGVTRQQYDKYEKKRHRPTPKNMEKLSEALGTKFANVVMYFYQ